MRRRAAALAAALVLAACHTVRYQTKLEPGGETHRKMVSYFFWGLGGSHDIDLDAYCPEGVAAWSNRATFGNVLIDLFTLGIWSPRTVEIECAGGRR